ncbi:MAG: 30S ribosomal protein S6 [bacterium]|nr:30S ribosomal protein S6 [bacterium]
MRDYELMCILNPDLEESRIEEILNRLQDIVKNNGGEVQGVDKWGKRRLAYPIKKFRDGYYVVMNFKGNNELLKELDRVAKIIEENLRHMIVRRD